MNTFRTSLPRALKATQAAAGQRLSSTPLRQAKRAYASASTASTGSNAAVFFGGLVAGVLAGGAGYYATATQRPGDTKSSIIRNANKVTPKESSPPPRQHATDTAKAASRDYQKVYNAIAQRLIEMDEYDDGSYGPVLVRLAWHASGTFDKETGTGGSNGATMRFPPEGDHGANAGLRAARDFLEPVKEQFPWIHYSDLWILAGICAFQEMQGPTIPWRPGRSDRDVSFCTPDGRLPDGSKEHDHLRAIFYRMGFDDREIVALSGAHALGRCHTDRSGFDGPWTFSPTTLTNDYYKLLLEEKWSYRKWDGPKQFQDVASKSLMMLPSDMALIKDKNFRKHVDRYANDVEVFFKEFSDVIVKLFELGVPFTSGEESRMTFKTLAAQEA